MSMTPAGKPPHFHMRWYWLVFVLIIAFAILPMFTMAYGISVANSHDCAVTEGNINPCIIDGVDQGQTLAALSMSYLYIFWTFPLAVGFFGFWLAVLLIHRYRWNKRQQGVSVAP